jgi:hypothetical protein
MAFDYTSRDFYSIRQDLFDRAARLIPEWSTRDASDFGVALVELWAYSADILNYYIDRAANEAFLSSATQRESLLAYANLLDYTPRTIRAASATVTINTSKAPTTITIPAGTAFTAPATSSRIPLTFYTTSPVTCSSASNVIVSVVEGMQTTDELVGVSTGNTNQRFSLFYKNVDASSIEVYVYEGAGNTARQYTYLDRLINASATQTAFTTETDANGVTYVVFGNNINGRIPTNGKDIKVTYRRTNGIVGNVLANAITQFKNTFTGSQYLSIASSTAGYGGAEAEGIESLRASIPKAFATLDRAVSLQDFKDLALRVEGVAKATAYNPTGASVVVYPVAYQSNYEEYTGTTISTSSLVTPVLNYFAPRQMVGASVGVASVIDLVPINISASVTIASTYVKSKVFDDITAALNSLFTFDAVSFGQTISKGLFYRTMMAIEGVDYVSGFEWAYGSGVGTPITTETYTVDQRQLPRKGTFTLTIYGGVG